MKNLNENKTFLHASEIWRALLCKTCSNPAGPRSCTLADNGSQALVRYATSCSEAQDGQGKDGLLAHSRRARVASVQRMVSPPLNSCTAITELCVIAGQILIVCTSASDLGGHPTGLWIEELAAPYYVCCAPSSLRCCMLAVICRYVLHIKMYTLLIRSSKRRATRLRLLRSAVALSPSTVEAWEPTSSRTHPRNSCTTLRPWVP